MKEELMVRMRWLSRGVYGDVVPENRGTKNHFINYTLTFNQNKCEHVVAFILNRQALLSRTAFYMWLINWARL